MLLRSPATTISHGMMFPGKGRSVERRLLVACLALLFSATAVLAAGETVFVTVQKTSVRKDRQFYAPAVAAAVFRDQLTVLARERDWVRVRFKGSEGWVHVSATATRAVSVTAKDATAGVSQDDVAFASKGFDASVEREYRKGQSKVDFAGVDRMEQFSVSENYLADFRQVGNLQPRGDKR